ncbi:nitroreductase family protein [Thermosipho ferrireducens]|uniref:Nitroreductase family protein n=1 Tax=Thermosipho ferrireducens TaxID=2571116 RepID=A0ABX7S7I5_9BACT|nr:nitroreductase family protein [Thermosipho ferrireducens]QTA37765.1 nitroreductase family protein [Thermosipho ferrireducens]
MIFELAKNRKTIRKFKKDNPPIEDLIYAIECAKEAPSGMNSQPWIFVIIRNEKLKRKIREICERNEKSFYQTAKGPLKEFLLKNNINWKKEFLTQAPYLIAAFSYIKAPFAKESLWISIGYILLALEEKGLSTVTYTPSDPKEISKILNTPAEYKLEVILPVGYSADNKKKCKRKNVNEIIFFDNFVGGE